MEFHERLKELRKSKGLTQRQVAQAIGIVERNYQKFEYGENKPSYSALLALADFFEVSLDCLTGRNKKEKK